jgi:hypothetical protein
LVISLKPHRKSFFGHLDSLNQANQSWRFQFWVWLWEWYVYFTSNFFQNSDQVVVFPTEPKEYSEDLGFTITSSTPPTGTPFCIRFYDGPQKGEARYNTVTGDNWLWPAFPNGSSIPTNLYIKIASGSEPAGSSWKYGSTFEDNTNRFKTTISPQYTIGVAISDYSNGQGSVTDINGSYGWGDTVNLAATPAPHSGFMGWIGEGIAETLESKYYPDR